LIGNYTYVYGTVPTLTDGVCSEFNTSNSCSANGWTNFVL